MQFVDEASIQVEAGKGGDGCLSFRREKRIARGGPDGGHGGDGGDVVLLADEALTTLVDFRYQPRYRARNGAPGMGRDRAGRGGGTLEIRVPVGTTVIDDDTLETLGDLREPGARLLVARGGRRGLGNSAFKSSTNRAPRQTTPGEPGESRRLRLQLRVLADIGLLGMPNAGKSTLLSRVSASRPRIADYPFTTLTPHLGVVRAGEGESFVMADIPGLIAGAREGAGLGSRFLRHLSRCRVLLHLLDAAPPDGSDPLANLRSIDAELAAYSPALARRPCWVVLGKCDLLDAPAREALLARLRSAEAEAGPDARPVHAVSALDGSGVEALVRDLAALLRERRARLERDRDAERCERELEARIAQDVLAHALRMPPRRREGTTGPGADTEVDEGAVRHRSDP